MISLPSFFCSCDYSAAEQAASSDSISCSCLREAHSPLTKQADFCFDSFFLVVEATDTLQGWVSSLAIVSVGMFSDPETLFS